MRRRDPQRAADTEREADRAEHDPCSDADDDACRRGAREVIDEQAEHSASDDRSDEQPAETQKVTAAQGAVVVFIDHRVGPISRS